MTMQQYCLRWNNHQPNFISVFSSLLNNESLVDVTLAAEGKHLQAHKVVLAACSSYFQSVFTVNPCQHPIVILKDVKFLDLKVMVDFMYYGEVNVSQEQLPHILKTAEMLKIKGLAEIPVDQSTLAKSHNNVNDRAEVITGDTHWNTEDMHGHTLSPSPSPLSPASRRKRFRKASTGSGSGSTERILEEQPLSEVTVTSPGGSVIGTVIKPDPGGFSSDSSPPLHNKHFSSDTELHRSSSHESNGDCPQQITLQVPQQQESLPGVDPIPSSLDVGSSINQQTTAGYQWGVMDGAYTRYALSSCQSNITVPPDASYTQLQQCHTLNGDLTSTNDSEVSSIDHANISSLAQQNLQKRRRSVNPQADENFVRALDAVRYGGIGFCKAAKMYGVNNRTLWLEFKKRGYPNNRLSIKNRKQEFINPCSISDNPSSPIDDANSSIEPKPTVACAEATASSTHATIVSAAYFDSRQIELTSLLQRPRYFDVGIGVNQQHAVSLTGVSFEQM